MFVVISGTSRGIGLSLIQLAFNKGQKVVALLRSSTTEPGHSPMTKIILLINPGDFNPGTSRLG